MLVQFRQKEPPDHRKPYQCGKRELRVRCGQNVQDIPSALPRKSRNSIDDRSYPGEDHSDPLSVASASAHPVFFFATLSAPALTSLTGKKGCERSSTNHSLRILDVHHTHPFDLLWREETKLDLLDCAQWRLGVWEVDVRHFGGRSRVNGDS